MSNATRNCSVNRSLRFVAIAALVQIVWLIPPPASAGVIEEITFQSGSIGEFGAPVASGWQFFQANNSAQIDDANSATGFQRTFTHGTNNEALLIRPFGVELIEGGPDPNTFRDAQGAFWIDTSGMPEVVDADEVVYTVWEHYSEFSRSNQRWKTQLFLGKGSGNEDGAFSDDPNSVARVTWTWGDNADGYSTMNSTLWNNGAVDCGNGTQSCGTLGGEFSGTRYGTAALPPGGTNPTSGIGPTPADLEATHLSIQVFRTVTDDGTPTGNVLGTELELNDTRGVFNGGDTGNRNATPGWDPAWGGNPASMVGVPIDQLGVSMWRYVGFNNLSGDAGNVTPGWIDINQTDPSAPNSPVNGSIGVKYLRVGTANYLDVNIDGVVDAADKAIVQANLGLSATNNTTHNATGATFFDGDVDNDLDVDEDDLALYSAIVGTPGDYDGDSDVDGADFLLIQRGFGATTSGTDFNVWGSNFGSSAGAIAAASAVPEPSALALLLTGVCRFSRSDRRKQTL